MDGSQGRDWYALKNKARDQDRALMFYYRCDATQGQSVWRFIAYATTNGVQETNKITDLFQRTSGSNLTADPAIRTCTDVKHCDYECVMCLLFYFFLSISPKSAHFPHLKKQPCLLLFLNNSLSSLLFPVPPHLSYLLGSSSFYNTPPPLFFLL